MPTVPRIRDERIQTAPLPTVRQRPYATEETFGGGPTAERTAAASSRALEASRQMLEEEFRRANELAVLNASAKLSAAENALLHDPTTGAFTKRGQAALGVPEQVRQDYDQTVRDLEGALTNETQRAAFQRQALERRVAIEQQVQKHVAAQIQAYDEEITTASLTNEREAAALNYLDPARVEQSFRRRAMLIKRKQQRDGLPQAWLTAALAEDTSATHRLIIERMLGDGYPGVEDYIGRVKAKLSSDDLRVVEKARTEADRLKKETQDDLERQLVLEAVDDKVTISQLRQMLAANKIDTAFYEKMVKRLTDVNDDITISNQDKAARLAEVARRYTALHAGWFTRAKVATGTLTPTKREAKGNTLKELQAFRAFVAESAPYLTKEQERAFYQYTQRDLDAKTAAKVGIFHAATTLLSSLPALVGIAGITQMLGTLKPSVSAADAATMAEQVTQEAVVATNPNRTRYRIGQVLTNANGLQAEVVGFDERGNPRLKWK